MNEGAKLPAYFKGGNGMLPKIPEFSFDSLASRRLPRHNMPFNQAAWIPSKSAKTFRVSTSPCTPPSENEIVVKNSTIAINPVDWLKQDADNMMLSWIEYPFIMDGDLAGLVV